MSPPWNSAQVEYPKAAMVPIEIRVSMLAEKFAARRTAFFKNGQPAQNWTGRVRANEVYRAQGWDMTTKPSTITVRPSGQLTTTRLAQNRRKTSSWSFVAAFSLAGMAW